MRKTFRRRGGRGRNNFHDSTLPARFEGALRDALFANHKSSTTNDKYESLDHANRGRNHRQHGMHFLRRDALTSDLTGKTSSLDF
jgi:hypothetical protein